MKKIISAVIAVSVLSSCFILTGGAAEKSGNVPAIVNICEKAFGAIVSLSARAINKINKTDETKIPQAVGSYEAGKPASTDGIIENPGQIVEAETWKCVEICFESDKKYADPFNDVETDLTLTGGGRQYTVPGFWDGGNVFKFRFVCPYEGDYYFSTACTDSENETLNGRTGKVICKKYSGDFEIYKHGFTTTRFGKKYITYDDGIPFFYLGDTHWSLGDETTDMVRTICEKRVSQGFTVIQSEPIGEKFDFANGITEDDMQGLHAYDEKFAIIAENGLVHANAEFMFPGYMAGLIANQGENTEKYLEKITRFWVARYSAYPVMWTLGQEVDADFYYDNEPGRNWGKDYNPYLSIAKYIEKYDPYNHPLTAHQENSGKTRASNSLLKNASNHSWFAAQFSPSLTSQSKFEAEKDFWYNSDGKPVIDYEGRYCYLWTKNFGARMQGWFAYLNGMYGYGWGAHDTWSYLNTYDENNDSTDGVDTVTSAEKTNATWQDALEYESSYQCGFLKEFLTKIVRNWYEFIPRFDNRAYFSPCLNVYYSYAGTADNSKAMIYFYSFADKTVAEKPNAKLYSGALTGTIGSLQPKTEYKYVWFNPITGECSAEGTFVSSAIGTYYIGERIFGGRNVNCDMVFYMYKA